MPNAESLSIAALVVALVGALLLARRVGLNTRVTYWAGVVGIAAGLISGAALAAATRPPAFWDAGISSYGFLIGAAVGGGLYLRLRRLPILPYADATAPATALAYAIARVGCFLNGDDFGRLSSAPWAVTFSPKTEAFAAHLARAWVSASSPASLPVEPVQLYAAALGLVLFAQTLTMRRRPGMPVAIAALGYGFGRFPLEWLRDDFHPWRFGLSLPQVLSVILALIGVVVLVRGRRSAQPETAVTAPPQAVLAP